MCVRMRVRRCRLRDPCGKGGRANSAPWCPCPQVLEPEKQADMLDSLRIHLLQFATLLVEHAPHHIHDNYKNRNSKLRRLMTFAWPCLLSKACVDPACKYSGHLLLAHIIAKFAIHKKIVLQVPARPAPPGASSARCPYRGSCRRAPGSSPVVRPRPPQPLLCPPPACC